MNVLVTGGTGFVGNKVVSLLCARGDRVTIVTRDPSHHQTANSKVTFERWLPDVSRFDAVVHLAGASIAGKRWTEEYKRELVSSRVDSTRQIVEAMAQQKKRPRVFVVASAAGWYGDRGEETLTENSAPADDFLARLCVEWERAADPAEALGVRVVHPRFGLVMGREGGALPKSLTLFKLGLGGPLGPRSSWFPWVYVGDVARFILTAIDDDNLRGSYNVVAPGIVRQGEFARTLGRVLSRPAILPVPKLALRIVLGEVAHALTASQRVVPERTLAAGFVFQQLELEAALKHTLRKE